MKAVLGEMEFGDLLVGGDKFKVVVIYRIDVVMNVDDEEQADGLLGTSQAYIIPDLNRREVVFANAETANKWQQEVA